jgi:DNA repair protein RecO (recombination protein O)
VEVTPAILLRKTRLTETSLIITWFSQAHGRIRTVAKGARQPKSRFAGMLDLFFRCEIQFARSRKSELHILREVALHETFEGLRGDYRRVALAAYAVELLELVTESDHAVPELYDLLQRLLGHLHAQPASLRALLHYESELSRLLGIAQSGVPAAVALGRAHQRLPRSRGDLIQSLRTAPERHSTGDPRSEPEGPPPNEAAI